MQGLRSSTVRKVVTWVTLLYMNEIAVGTSEGNTLCGVTRQRRPGTFEPFGRQVYQ